jgi:hypothetical protein
MFEPIIPRALHHLSRMTLVLFPRRIADEPDVIVHVEVEQGSRLAARLVDDKVVEGVRVRDDQVFLCSSALWS